MQQCNKINLRTKKPEIAVFRRGQMRHVQHVESAHKCCTCGQMLHLRTNVAAITILNKQQVLTNRDKQCESRNNHKGVHCVDLGESFPTHSNACLLAKVGFDTPENEPFEVRQLDNWVRPNIGLPTPWSSSKARGMSVLTSAPCTTSLRWATFADTSGSCVS